MKMKKDMGMENQPFLTVILMKDSTKMENGTGMEHTDLKI